MSWVDMATILLDVGRTAMGLAVNWLIQSTLLIAGGLAVGYLLRHRGSAVQSAVYRTTLVAALVCPLATWGLSLLGVSGWSLQMPTAYSAPPAIVPTIQTAKPEPALLTETRFDSVPTIDATTATSSNALNSPPLATADKHGLDATRSPALLEAATPSVSANEIANERTFDVHRFGFLAAAVTVLWCIAGTCLLCRLAVAWWQLHRLRVGARSAELPTIESCREIAAWLHVAPPEVLHSPYLPSPCLAGLRRPVVMLPESELSLTVRDVLVHELAHLVRNDCLWNVARQVSTAVLFFQPLAWILSRRLAATAEEVCDDYVVQFGGDRREYANRLVDVASMYIAPVAAAGVGIVSFRSMLAARVARILDTSRSLSTRIGHLLLAIVLIVGLAATLLVGLVGLQSAPIAADAEAAKSADAKSDDKDNLTKSPEASGKPEDADVVTVHGQVVDPKGAVAKNTDVYVIRWYWNYGDRQRLPLAKTKTDDQGRFTISYRKSQFVEDSGRPDQWREAMVVAFADGFGFGWVTHRDLAPGEDAELKLVADDVPIEGRILDLEGKPVSGATIEVQYLNDSKNGSLDDWLAAVRARQSVQAAAKYLNGGVPLVSAQRWQGIKTDAEGHFRLVGIGRERQLNIQVSGPTIVTSTLSVMTRDMKPIAQPAYNYREARDRINYGAKFEYTAAPSRPIEGIVRDAKTHDPIAGVEIWSYKFAGETISNITTIKTKSDAKGHYRLEGMPKGAGNKILIVPTDLPYFTRKFDVPDPPGIDPTPFDIELHRGQWISGRVIDGATKQGVAALIWYIVPPDNPLAAKLPEFQYGQHLMDVQDRFHTKADGSYRVVGVPGRGVIGVGASAAYPSGQGIESIKGVEDRESFMKYNGVFAPIKKHPTAVKEVEVSAGSDATMCDFELDAGRRITVNAVDPDGKPIKDFVVDGCRGTSDNYQKIDNPEFDVAAMRDDEVRTVLVYQKARKL